MLQGYCPHTALASNIFCAKTQDNKDNSVQSTICEQYCVLPLLWLLVSLCTCRRFNTVAHLPCHKTPTVHEKRFRVRVYCTSAYMCLYTGGCDDLSRLSHYLAMLTGYQMQSQDGTASSSIYTECRAFRRARDTEKTIVRGGGLSRVIQLACHTPSVRI